MPSQFSLLTKLVSIHVKLVDQNCLFLTEQNIDIKTTLGPWVQILWNHHFILVTWGGGKEVLTLTVTDYHVKSGQQGQSYTWTVFACNWYPWHNEW